MRTWAAMIAALVIIAAFLGAGYISIYSIANERNQSVLDAMRECVRATGSITNEVSIEDRLTALNEVDEATVFSMGYFDANVEILWQSNEGALKTAGVDFSNMKPEQVETLTQQATDGHIWIYAIFPYTDGTALVFSSEKQTVIGMLQTHYGYLIAGALLIVAVSVLCAFLRSVHRTEKGISQAMQTLDRISEGDYEARISAIPGESSTIAEYNAIIDRLQNRIFRQRNQNQALSVVMTQMQNGILAVDADLNVILLTPVAKKLLGIVGSAEGKPVTQVTPDVNLEDAFKSAMQQKGVYTNDVAARTTVGRGHRPLRLYVSPMRTDGRVVGALAMIEDITELRRLEQVRTDFAANVSHELKTPLTSIRGFVETLEAGAIDNPEMAHKFLRIIMVETERLTRLINDILSISKLESGDDDVAIERIRIDKLAADVVEMLQIHAGEKGITLHARINEKPAWIMGNPDRVEQMLINLVENGIKYNNPGGSVTVQVFSSKDEVNITISDTGIGIAEEHLPRLFERFYRVDKGRSRAMGGTGLGLAIVKHIVRSMKGEIEVQSKLGEGTEFLITLPLSKGEDSNDTIFE